MLRHRAVGGGDPKVPLGDPLPDLAGVALAMRVVRDGLRPSIPEEVTEVWWVLPRRAGLQMRPLARRPPRPARARRRKVGRRARMFLQWPAAGVAASMCGIDSVESGTSTLGRPARSGCRSVAPGQDGSRRVVGMWNRSLTYNAHGRARELPTRTIGGLAHFRLYLVSAPPFVVVTTI